MGCPTYALISTQLADAVCSTNTEAESRRRQRRHRATVSFPAPIAPLSPPRELVRDRPITAAWFAKPEAILDGLAGTTSAMSTLADCPYCREQISLDASVCSHCAHDVSLLRHAKARIDHLERELRFGPPGVGVDEKASPDARRLRAIGLAAAASCAIVYFIGIGDLERAQELMVYVGFATGAVAWLIARGCSLGLLFFIGFLMPLICVSFGYLLSDISLSRLQGVEATVLRHMLEDFARLSLRCGLASTGGGVLALVLFPGRRQPGGPTLQNALAGPRQASSWLSGAESLLLKVAGVLSALLSVASIIWSVFRPSS